MAFLFSPTFDAFENFTWPDIDGTVETFNDGVTVGRGRAILSGMVSFGSAYIVTDPQQNFAY